MIHSYLYKGKLTDFFTSGSVFTMPVMEEIDRSNTSYDAEWVPVVSEAL